MMKCVQEFKSLFQNSVFETSKTAWVYYGLSLILLLATQVNGFMFLLLLLQPLIVVCICIWLILACLSYFCLAEFFRNLFSLHLKPISTYLLGILFCVPFTFAPFLLLTDYIKPLIQTLSAPLDHLNNLFLLLFIVVYGCACVRMAYNTFIRAVFQNKGKLTFDPKSKDNLRYLEVSFHRTFLTFSGVKPLISIAIISYFCFRLIGFQGQIFDILKSVLLFLAALIFMLPICDVKESRFKEALEKVSKGEKGAKAGHPLKKVTPQKRKK